MKPIKPRLVMLRGLPGAGKSTAVPAIQAMLKGPSIRVSRDGLRGMAKLTGPKNSRLFHEMEKEIVGYALQHGISVVVDDPNLAKRHVRKWTEMAMQHGAEFEEFSLLGVPIEKCIARDAQRKTAKRVGEEVIRHLAATVDQ